MKRKRESVFTPRKRRRGGGYQAQVARNRAMQRAAIRTLANARVSGYTGIELKFYDQYVDGTNFDSTAGTPWIVSPQGTSTLCLNTVAQGDGESNRDGRQIKMKSLDFRCLIRYPPQNNVLSLSTVPMVCVWVILDKQCNGTAPSATSIVDTSTGGVGIDCVAYFNDIANGKRFKVLCREVLTPISPGCAFDSAQGDNDATGSQFYFEKHINLNSLAVNYTNTTEAIASIADCAIYVMAASDVASTPIISYRSRLRFVG